MGDLENRFFFNPANQVLTSLNPALTSLIQETGINQFFEEKFDVSELRVLNPERLQQTDVSVLDSHEDGSLNHSKIYI